VEVGGSELGVTTRGGGKRTVKMGKVHESTTRECWNDVGEKKTYHKKKNCGGGK